jgi:hypothetical protein
MKILITAGLFYPSKQGGPSKTGVTNFAGTKS